MLAAIYILTLHRRIIIAETQIPAICAPPGRSNILPLIREE